MNVFEIYGNTRDIFETEAYNRFLVNLLTAAMIRQDMPGSQVNQATLVMDLFEIHSIFSKQNSMSGFQTITTVVDVFEI